MNLLLPHEFRLLKIASSDLEGELKDLADEKADAQGANYDWHDNAPLDVVEHAQGLAGGRKAGIDTLLNTSEMSVYPTEHDVCIKLGSLVLAKDKFGDLPFLVVGQRLVGVEAYQQAWGADFAADPEDLSVVTPASPLGKAALGVVIGNSITYSITGGDKDVTVNIMEINQTWLQQRFGQEA